MKGWTELQISIVYYAGLFLALLASASTLLYLRPINFMIKKISEKSDKWWTGSFKVTVVLAGLLGAMSVSFRDCTGDYDHLLDSPDITIKKGLQQVSTSFSFLISIFGMWFVIFLVLYLTKKKMGGT
jgi:hypothetical protein